VRPHPDWLLPGWQIPGVHGFMTTRAGGVSSGPFGCGEQGGLNLGLLTGDDPERVRENRARLRSALPASPRWLRQVHGSAVVDAAKISEPIEADASFTSAARVVCVVSVADCMPVLLADAKGRAVAAAHAGWRGLASGVIQATVEALRSQIGDSGARLHAWLGPAIGPRHFEVGAEVLVAMRARLPHADTCFHARRGDKFLADLPSLARQALAQAGVEVVIGGNHCTFSDTARFYSFRRDKVTGRHAAVIWLER
jgi:YfiH family protein